MIKNQTTNEKNEEAFEVCPSLDKMLNYNLTEDQQSRKYDDIERKFQTKQNLTIKNNRFIYVSNDLLTSKSKL